jgi:hypothetical protein
MDDDEVQASDDSIDFISDDSGTSGVMVEIGNC